jgi:hypothetical protein
MGGEGVGGAEQLFISAKKHAVSVRFTFAPFFQY